MSDLILQLGMKYISGRLMNYLLIYRGFLDFEKKSIKIDDVFYT